MRAAIAALCARTGLTGINSCDFLLDGDAFELLEINTRPSSTMTLYETASPDAWPRGLLACHIEHAATAACRRLLRLRPPRRRAGQQRAVRAASVHRVPTLQRRLSARPALPRRTNARHVDRSRPAGLHAARARGFDRRGHGTRSKRSARSFCNESKPAMSPTMPSSNATPERLSHRSPVRPPERQRAQRASRQPPGRRSRALRRVAISHAGNGTVIVDAGVEAPGSVAAGVLIARICMGGLGHVAVRDEPGCASRCGRA